MWQSRCPEALFIRAPAENACCAQTPDLLVLHPSSPTPSLRTGACHPAYLKGAGVALQDRVDRRRNEAGRGKQQPCDSTGHVAARFVQILARSCWVAGNPGLQDRLNRRIRQRVVARVNDAAQCVGERERARRRFRRRLQRDNMEVPAVQEHLQARDLRKGGCEKSRKEGCLAGGPSTAQPRTGTTTRHHTTARHGTYAVVAGLGLQPCWEVLGSLDEQELPVRVGDPGNPPLSRSAPLELGPAAGSVARTRTRTHVATTSGSVRVRWVMSATMNHSSAWLSPTTVVPRRHGRRLRGHTDPPPAPPPAAPPAPPPPTGSGTTARRSNGCLCQTYPATHGSVTCRTRASSACRAESSRAESSRARRGQGQRSPHVPPLAPRGLVPAGPQWLSQLRPQRRQRAPPEAAPASTARTPQCLSWSKTRDVTKLKWPGGSVPPCSRKSPSCLKPFLTLSLCPLSLALSSPERGYITLYIAIVHDLLRLLN